MSRVWTENQSNAITARGGSVIVSAAAGSGKTAVLVERVIRMITDEKNGVRADRLLVVTYTRAAAAELRERLSLALSERIAADPTNRFLLTQQTLLSKANISTVDSFCSSLVKEYFYELDIDRNFRIADESELSVIRDDALMLTLDALYTERDPKFLALVELFASARDDIVLRRNILTIYDFLRSHPFPERWMDEKLAYYTDFTDVASSVWGRIILDYAKEAADYLISLAESSCRLIEGDDNLFKALSGLFDKDARFAESLKETISGGKWDEIALCVRGFDKGRFSAPRGYKENPLKRAAESNRKTFKSTVETLSSLFAQNELDCLYDIELLGDTTAQMFRAVRLFGENYAALKAERRIADYPDLEHWTLSLLIDPDSMQPTAVAREIASRFDEIMVDEYQDANETQDTIFSVLSSGGRNLFVVGDVKQSIYGFRQAMPELFLKRKNNAGSWNKTNPRFPAKIILEKNFRSEATLLSGINFIFEKLMSEAVGEIEYNEEERLYPGAEYAPPAEPSMELDILDRSQMGEDEAAVCEARFIAERIMQMIASGYPVKDGDGYRPAMLGDFAVLMRSPKRIAPVYVDVLNSCGLRSFAESSHSFLSAHEIMVMTNFLRVINNPCLDIELLSVMMCPVFAFTEDDLARIRCRSRHTSLYAAVMLDADSGNKKSEYFLSELAYYRSISVTVPLSKLVSLIYERSSFPAIYCAGSESSVPRRNLRLLLDYARTFEQNTRKGLSAFVSYLDRLVQRESDLPAASSDSDVTQNGVRIMSIHASKGLEFPVTFIADTCRLFNSDVKENVLLHSRYGFAVKRRDIALSAMYNTMPRKALALEISRSEMSEELRVLYVAMTRARQKLIMISSPKRAESFIERNAARVSSGEALPFAVRSASSLGDWMTMCALLHPDADVLRDFCTSEVEYDSRADFRLDCRVITSDPSSGQAADPAAEPAEIAADTSVAEMLRQHAEFSYPYEGLRGLPVKVAASELAHRYSSKAFDRILARPAFLSGESLTAADKGTALHAFMQYADFDCAGEDIEAEITRLSGSGHLTEAQAKVIDRERALRFIRSPLADRVRAAEKVYKEYRFTVRIPASMVNADVDERFADEPVVLQGAVDLAFVEDGKLVIVDYKTDRVKALRELTDMYASQLLFYKRALEECLQLPVKECLIYSVRLCDQIEVKEA